MGIGVYDLWDMMISYTNMHGLLQPRWSWHDLYWEVDQPMGGCRALHSSASQSDRRQQQSCIPEDQLEGLHGEDDHPAVPITYTCASYVTEIPRHVQTAWIVADLNSWIICDLQVGNPDIDNYWDSVGDIDYYYSHAMISVETYKALQQSCNFSDVNCCSQQCDDAFNQAYTEIGNIDYYSINTPACLSSAATAGTAGSSTRPADFSRLHRKNPVCILYLVAPSTTKFLCFHSCACTLHFPNCCCGLLSMLDCVLSKTGVFEESRVRSM